MPPLSLLIRRAHLYLAMLCLPWVVMYGVSSAAFNHPGWLPQAPSLFDTSGPEWTQVGSWTANVDFPDGEAPREAAGELLAIAGLDADMFAAFRVAPRRVQVEVQSFWRNQRLTYEMDEGLLVYHTAPKYPQQILTDMHARAGYERGVPSASVWAFMVDLVAIGFLGWVLSGLYMWWQLPRMRGWGALALGSGFAVFAAFLLLL